MGRWLIWLALLLGGCLAQQPTPQPTASVAVVVSASPRQPLARLPEGRPDPGRREGQRLTLQTQPPPPPRAPAVTPTAPPAKPTPQRPTPRPMIPGGSYPTATNGPARTTQTQQPSPRAYQERARQSAQQLHSLIARGKLQAYFQGTGDATYMAELNLSNPGRRPITVSLEPGMVLRPPDGQRVQPLLVATQTTVTLAPETTLRIPLESFCMDARVPAPMAYEPIDYEVSSKARQGGPEAVEVLRRSQEMDLGELEPYRRAIVQIAIWKSLRQPVGERQLQSVLRADYYHSELRQTVLRAAQQLAR